MANSEHIIILKQGVAHWNNWRKNNPHVIPDLSNASIIGKDLDKINFEKANLSHVNLSGIAGLKYANFEKADLRGANLSEAYLTGANLKYANLDDANLLEAQIDFAEIQDASFIHANLADANLNCTWMKNTTFCEANLINATFGSSKIFSANFHYTKQLNIMNLRKASFVFDIMMPDGTHIIMPDGTAHKKIV